MHDRIELFYIKGELAYGNLPLDLAKELSLDISYFGPSNLSWIKQVNFSSPLEYLSSNEKKKILKAKEFAISELGYKVELNDHLLENDFLEWIKLYQENVAKKEVGTPWIDESWYSNNMNIDRFGSIIIKDQNQKIIGGALLNRTNKDDSISCAYRAHEYIKIKDSSLSALIELTIDEYALKFNHDKIKRGTDENIYGIRLSNGLKEFKEHYRFVAHPLDDHGSYYPRVLVFFKEFENVITFTYKDFNDSREVTEVKILKTSVTDFSKLKK